MNGREEKYRQKLINRFKDVESYNELADVCGALISIATEDREDYLQIMDGLVEFLRDHRDENFIRDIYNFHKPKYSLAQQGKVKTTPGPSALENIVRAIKEGWTR